MPTNAMPLHASFDRASSSQSDSSRPSVDLGVSLNTESRHVFYRMAGAESAPAPHSKLLSAAESQVAARKAMLSSFANMFKF
jgi:hypothetical protein